MANQVLNNVRAFDLRNVAVLRNIPKIFPESQKTKIILMITAATGAVFLWAAILSADRNYHTSSNITDSQTTLDTNQVPDPIAPAAAIDDSSHAAPPSGQASSSVSIEAADGKTSVTVNGNKVDVPTNGSTTQTYVSPDGQQSNVSITTSSTGTATNSSNSFTSTNVNSSSFSSSFGIGNTQQSVNISGGSQ